MATLGTRAISRVQGGSGISQAKKLADLYVSTNTGSDGDVTDPAVYDNAIKNILAPYAATVDGQNAIADYNNKKKALTAKQADVNRDVSALKLKEYSAFYVDDDGQDDTSFRNPAWVAQVTSESLDMILAETVSTIDERRSQGKSIAELQTYLSDLIKRSDRMRTLSDSLNDDNGASVNLDGYGYYLDTDPNTGQIRGASFMPTDVPFADLAQGTTRTDSKVKVGNKTVPVYLPSVKADDGTSKTVFGGKEYTGDSNLLSGNDAEIALSDRNSYKSVDSKFEIGKAYKAFNGKTNIDGSSQSDYFYVGRDNKMYRFSDNDPNGKAFLDSLRSVGAIGANIPKISPIDAQSYSTNPLPSEPSFTQSEQRGAKIRTLQTEASAMQAEADRQENLGSLGQTFEGGADLVKKGISAVSSFFGRKNRPNQPETPPPAPIDSGKSFFMGRVQ